MENPKATFYELVKKSTPNHYSYTSDHDSGSLSEEVANKYPQGYRNSITTKRNQRPVPPVVYSN